MDLMKLTGAHMRSVPVAFTTVDHGRIETRNIGTSTELNDYLDFPHVGEVFMIEHVIYFTKTEKEIKVTAFGVTRKSTDQANAENMTRLRRFAVGLEKNKGIKNVSQKVRQLVMTLRAILDFMRMTKNCCRVSVP